MKYEYKVVSITWNSSHDYFEKELNRYGADGWEAIDFRWHQGSHDFTTVTFKRSIMAAPEAVLIPNHDTQYAVDPWNGN